MGYAQALDLRRRVISAVSAGASAREAARGFDVSRSSAIKPVQRWRDTGSHAPRRIGGRNKRPPLSGEGLAARGDGFGAGRDAHGIARSLGLQGHPDFPSSHQHDAGGARLSL